MPAGTPGAIPTVVEPTTTSPTVGTFRIDSKMTAEEYYKKNLQVMSDMTRLLADLNIAVDKLANITDDGNSDIVNAVKKYSSVIY